MTFSFRSTTWDGGRARAAAHGPQSARRACPKVRSGIKAAAQPSGFLRTYSARIYFIVSNSSLACLHMPHPSNPVDDIAVRSYNRELRPRSPRGLEDVWIAASFLPSGWVGARTSELDVCLMDLFVCSFLYRFGPIKLRTFAALCRLA